MRRDPFTPVGRAGQRRVGIRALVFQPKSPVFRLVRPFRRINAPGRRLGIKKGGRPLILCQTARYDLLGMLDKGPCRRKDTPSSLRHAIILSQDYPSLIAISDDIGLSTDAKIFEGPWADRYAHYHRFGFCFNELN